MTIQAGVYHLRRSQFGKRSGNRVFAATGVDVTRRGSVTTFASYVRAWLGTGGNALVMWVPKKVGRNIRMASPANITSDEILRGDRHAGQPHKHT